MTTSLADATIAPVFRRLTNRAVAQRLARVVEDPSLMTHAWLFTGPPGSGRSVAADALATALVCPQGGCGACEACHTAARRSHPDIMWIRTEGSTIGVEAAHRATRELANRPSVARWRIVIIEAADRLSEGAANALLKSVEEPPPHSVVMLCSPSTEPRDIAVTLRSRCRHVYLPTPAPEAIAQILLDDPALSLTPHQAQWVAAVSGGHVGRARHLANPDKVALRKRQAALMLPVKVYEGAEVFWHIQDLVAAAEEEVASTLTPIEDKERAELEEAAGTAAKGRGVARITRGSAAGMKDLEQMQKQRRKRQAIDAVDLALMDIAGLYRDALLLSAGAWQGEGVASALPVGGFQHPDKASVSRELARRNGPHALLQCIDAVMDCRRELGPAVKPEVLLNGLAGHLQLCCGVV